uniref:Non-structural protein NS2 n=1 Tax=Baku virus TaxID=1484571 RepID=A0A3P8MIE8_9REOV|nr:viral inclusion body protein [Baku virus]
MAAEASKMIRRPFTKVLAIKSGGSDFVAQMCKTLAREYLVVKHGMGTQIVGADSPPPKSMLLLIPHEGAFRLLDRDQSLFVMVDRDGIEVAQDRWPGMRFETIDLVTRGVELTIAGQTITTEVRYGVAVGSVPPYVPDESKLKDDEPDFPGVKFIEVEGGMREFRERLREDAEVRASMLTTALHEAQPTRCLGRLMGMKNADLGRLRIREVPSRPRMLAPVGMADSTAPVTETRALAPPPPPPAKTASARPLVLEPAAVRTTVAPPPAPRPVSSQAARDSSVASTPVRSPSPALSAGDAALSYDDLIQSAYASLVQQEPELADYTPCRPGAIGLFSRDLGSYNIDPMQMECYAVDTLKCRFSRCGDAEARRLRVLVNDDRVYFVPEQ